MAVKFLSIDKFGNNIFSLTDSYVVDAVIDTSSNLPPASSYPKFKVLLQDTGDVVISNGTNWISFGNIHNDNLGIIDKDSGTLFISDGASIVSGLYLKKLGDVNTTNLNDGDAIVYDSNNDEFIGRKLGLPTGTNDQLLINDGTDWVPKNTRDIDAAFTVQSWINDTNNLITSGYYLGKMSLIDSYSNTIIEDSANNQVKIKYDYTNILNGCSSIRLVRPNNTSIIYTYDNTTLTFDGSYTVINVNETVLVNGIYRNKAYILYGFGELEASNYATREGLVFYFDSSNGTFKYLVDLKQKKGIVSSILDQEFYIWSNDRLYKLKDYFKSYFNRNFHIQYPYYASKHLFYNTAQDRFIIAMPSKGKVQLYYGVPAPNEETITWSFGYYNDSFGNDGFNYRGVAGHLNTKIFVGAGFQDEIIDQYHLTKGFYSYDYLNGQFNTLSQFPYPIGYADLHFYNNFGYVFGGLTVEQKEQPTNKGYYLWNDFNTDPTQPYWQEDSNISNLMADNTLPITPSGTNAIKDNDIENLYLTTGGFDVSGGYSDRVIQWNMSSGSIVSDSHQEKTTSVYYPNLPFRLNFHASFGRKVDNTTTNTLYYVLGGEKQNSDGTYSLSDIILKIKFNDTSWTTESVTLPAPMKNFEVVYNHVDDVAYIIGGEDTSTEFRDSIYVYDLVNNTMNPLKDSSLNNIVIPIPVKNFKAHFIYVWDGEGNTIKKEIWIIGGMKSDGTVSSTVQIYSFLTESWSTLTMNTGRYGFSTVIYFNQQSGAARTTEVITVFGGYTDTNNTITKVAERFLFDTSGNITQDTMADFPIDVVNCSSFLHDSSFVAVVMGGTSIADVYSASDTLLKYDITNDSFTVIKKGVPKKIYAYASAQYNSDIYLFGGITTNDKMINTILKYDPINDVITEVATTMPINIAKAVAVTYGDNIYILGGVTDTGNNYTVYRFDPITETVYVYVSSLHGGELTQAAVRNGKLFIYKMTDPHDKPTIIDLNSGTETTMLVPRASTLFYNSNNFINLNNAYLLTFINSASKPKANLAFDYLYNSTDDYIILTCYPSDDTNINDVQGIAEFKEKFY